MKNVLTIGCPVLVATLLSAGGVVYAADSPKLAAPLYKGAVPALPGDGIKKLPANAGTFGGVRALDCSRNPYSQVNKPVVQWCFLTKDPIDKVKAFYEKSVGPMQRYAGSWRWGEGGGSVNALSFGQYTERAWQEYPTEGETFRGFVYHGVSLHALKPPAEPRKKVQVMSDEPVPHQDAQAFYAGSRHFYGFMNGVAWFGPGDPSKREPAELDALFKKHGRLESAFFQRKGAKSEPVDETLRARTSKKQGELSQGAMGGMVPSQAQIQQMMQQAQRPMPANQSATPEDAEFNAFMRKNPKVAKRYTELTQKINTLMMQGKFDEADAVDEELEKLVQSHPELAALERRADERSAAAGAAHQARENQMIAGMNRQMDQANWGVWVDYLKAAEKEAYYTLIVIDQAYQGNEKDYSRDRGKFPAEDTSAPPHEEVFGFNYGAGAQPTRQAGSTSPAAQPAAAPEQPKPQDEIKDAAKKGWKALKKLF